jgi:hypothetical protein
VYTQTQIPGALQGLLVGGPFWLVAQPEAPYVLLNVLSFGALLLLGRYIHRRVPTLPRWFLWTTVLFTPWTLEMSTHIYNPSYVLAGAVLFFLGVFELMPSLRIEWMSRARAAFCLGCGLLWVYQLHMSAALLAPIAVLALVLAWRAEPRRAVVLGAAFAAGALVSGWTLLPTIAAVGLGGVGGSTGANIVFAPANLLRLPEIVAQTLSLGTIELPRFLGANTADRLSFLVRYWWAAPAIVVAVIAGTLQTAWLLGCLCFRRGAPGWPPVRAAMAALLLLLYGAFALSVKPPASHAVYVVLPVVLIYGAYCWDRLLRSRPMRVLMVVILVSGAIAQAAIAARNFTDRSLYTNRALVVRALAERNYHLLGERRWADK